VPVLLGPGWDDPIVTWRMDAITGSASEHGMWYESEDVEAACEARSNVRGTPGLCDNCE
jgi:hypothetical protein